MVVNVHDDYSTFVVTLILALAIFIFIFVIIFILRASLDAILLSNLQVHACCTYSGIHSEEVRGRQVEHAANGSAGVSRNDGVCLCTAIVL